MKQNIKKINNEVYYTFGNLIKLDKSDIVLIKGMAKSNSLQKCRLCTHESVEDLIHEMFITVGKEAYIRPHKHINKTESFYILEGSVDVIIFDDIGNISEVIQMGDYTSGKNFYYRLSYPYYHTLLINSEYLVFHEITKGPYKKEETIYAQWSPAENNDHEKLEYIQELRRKVKLIKK